MNANVSPKSREEEVCLPIHWHSLFSSESEEGKEGKRRKTLKTAFVPLDDDFLRYLLEEGVLLPKESSVHGVGDGTLSDDEDSHEISEEGPLKAPSFPELTKAISNAITSLGGKVFVKLNGESAMDAAWVNGGSFACQSAGDVYLLLKSSDKISRQAEEVLMTNSLNPPPHLSIVKWANLFPSMEFRCFVKDNQLVGISQRKCSTHFEFLRDEVQSIKDVVLSDFQENICGHFPLLSYVYDVYVDKKRRVWLMDFDVFGGATEPLLFTWEELGGADDVKVRVVQSAADLLPHTAGQSRGPTDVLDYKDQVSRVMQMSQEQLRNLEGSDSDSDRDRDIGNSNDIK